MNLSSVQRFRSTSRAVTRALVPQPFPSLSVVKTSIRRHWRRGVDLGLLLAVLGVAIGFTAHNLFHYPQYELDEGTYVGAAWTMVTQQELFYYTYTYAHPPLGWFQIGVWAQLTGGFDQFGMAINSGRVFMLVITVLSTLIIYRIVQVATQRCSAAALAGVLYAASPLAISLHRQVYLDNIGTFWLLLSILALQTANGRFIGILLSALAFGIAFLTKEVFAAMFPGMVFLVYLQSHPLQRRFATVLWTMVAGALMSFFTLLAFLKDELLPSGTLWSSSQPHVSLIETFTRQAGRGGGGLLDPQGSLWKNARLWWLNGPVLILGGAVALAVCLLFWRKDRLTFSIAILAGCFLVFLGRGGIVIYYYVIPLLALMALAIGLVVGHSENVVGRWRLFRPVVAPIVLSAAVISTGSAWGRNDLNFIVDDTTSQQAAAKWVVNNLSPSSIIVMDSYAWQDLRGEAFTNGRPFPYANYYWPLLSDQGLVESLLQNNWQEIDYLMVSPNTQADARAFELPLMQEALTRSDAIRTFSSGNWSQTIYRVRKLHRMRASEDPILVRTWNGDKARFVEQGRIVVDPVTQESTSQGQADALLRAVYANDRATFDAVWGWTEENLQIRGDGLLASTWTKGSDDTDGTTELRSMMTEGDEDAALALLFAYKLWGDPTYLQDAVVILNGVWQQETVEIAGTRVVVAGDWARGDMASGSPAPTIALSALSPYAYRIFAEADPDHPWMELVDSTYDLLSQIRASKDLGGSIGLAPDVVRLDPTSGTPRLADDSIDGANSFSVDGSRLLWRLTIDYLWFQDDRAKQGIDGLYFVRDQLASPDAQVFAAYTLDGTPLSGQESLALNAAIVPSLLVTNDSNLDVAHTQFTTKILRNYSATPDGAYWGKDSNDYATQTRAWFACAVMDGALTNIWAGDGVMRWDEVLPQK